MEMKQSSTSNNPRNKLFKVEEWRAPFFLVLSKVFGKNRVASVQRLPEFWMNSSKLCWFSLEDEAFFIRGDAMVDFLMNFDVAAMRITEME
jgi:hypothetical protein